MHRVVLKGFEKVAIHFIKSTQLITDSICTVHVRIRSRGDDTKQFSALQGDNSHWEDTDGYGSCTVARADLFKRRPYDGNGDSS